MYKIIKFSNTQFYTPKILFIKLSPMWCKNFVRFTESDLIRCQKIGIQLEIKEYITMKETQKTLNSYENNSYYYYFIWPGLLWLRTTISNIFTHMPHRTLQWSNLDKYFVSWMHPGITISIQNYIFSITTEFKMGQMERLCLNE